MRAAAVCRAQGAVGKHEKGPGESRAKGVFGLGASLEVKVPLGVRLGGEGHGGRTRRLHRKHFGLQFLHVRLCVSTLHRC